MWNNEVKNCSKKWTETGYCNSFDHCRGWGCKFIRIIPDFLPRSERDRAELFSKVYAEAETKEILACPYFVPTLIDEVVENDIELLSMMQKS